MISEANTGLAQAVAASSDQSSQFIIPKIELTLKGRVVSDPDVGFASSDTQSLNYFGLKDESQIKLTLKLKK